MRSESEFLVDVLGRLNAAGVDYMLTGSMASNYWGIPRTTHDLDFVLVMKPNGVDQLVSAFEAGFFIQPESVRSAFRPPFQFNVLDEQSAMKADFWLLPKDAFEQTAFGRRLPVVSLRRLRLDCHRGRHHSPQALLEQAHAVRAATRRCRRGVHGAVRVA